MITPMDFTTLNNLLKLLSDHQGHALSDLTRALEINEVTLQTLLSDCERLGIDVVIERQSNLRLIPNQALLHNNEINRQLSSHARKVLDSICLYSVIDSTNEQARRISQAGESRTALVVAEVQTAGRGRRGRHWVSPYASNLYWSLLWPVQGPQEAVAGMSLVTALAVVAALSQMGLEKTCELQVKWPNDVWLGGKKLAGILLEFDNTGTAPNNLIIGVGINVRLDPAARESIPQPVADLFTDGKIDCDRNHLVAVLANQLLEDLELFRQSGFGSFCERWQRYDALKHRSVDVHAGASVKTGIAMGVDKNGALILHINGKHELVHGGEVAATVRLNTRNGTKY